MMAGTLTCQTTGVGVVSAEWRMVMASDPMSAPVDRHCRACAGFGQVVAQVGDRWGRPSPCAEWDARGVLEHVIGFHDVLLLRPLGAKPQRPKDDPVARWQVTEAAISGLIRCRPRPCRRGARRPGDRPRASPAHADHRCAGPHLGLGPGRRCPHRSGSRAVPVVAGRRRRRTGHRRLRLVRPSGRRPSRCQRPSPAGGLHGS